MTLVLPARAAESQNRSADALQVAPGIYAVIRRDPHGLAVNANSLVVVGERDVLVVDAQFTREATLETLAAIRRITPNPVSWVVNTHWHDDHVAGNQVYRDSFPGVRFVLHDSTRLDLASIGRANREGTRRGAPPLVDRYQRLLDAGLGIDSTPVSEGERASLEAALRIMRVYLAEAPGFRESLDGPALRDRMRVRVAPHDVDVVWYGRANTRGDLVVSLPAAAVVATGDLLVAPVPFAFNAFPREWIAVLDSVAALRPRVIVPGHGAVQRDTRYLDEVRAMLVEVRDSVAAARARGDSLAALQRRLRLEAHRAGIPVDRKWRDWMFDNFFLGPAIRAAWTNP